MHDEEPSANRLSPGQLLLVIGIPAVIGVFIIVLVFATTTSETGTMPKNVKPSGSPRRTNSATPEQVAQVPPRVTNIRPEAEIEDTVPRRQPPIQPPIVPGAAPVSSHLLPRVAPAELAPAAPSQMLVHSWWKANITASKLDKLRSIICDHGSGLVFFDNDGNSAWADREQFSSCNSYGMIYQVALLAPELRGLGANRRFVLLRPGAALRHTPPQANLLIQDALNRSSSDAEFKKQQDIFRQLSEMQLP